MMLARITAGASGFDIRTFECLACDHVHQHVVALERFPAKWIPVRVKKTRQNKKESLRSDSIGTEKALADPMKSRETAGWLLGELHAPT
jgi:hypothetical protein